MIRPVLPLVPGDLPLEDRVDSALGAQLRAAFAPAGRYARLTPPRRGSLADSASTLHALDPSGRPLGVVQVGGELDQVRPEVERARAARDALGPALGQVVVPPLFVAPFEGGTVAAWPYCPPLVGRRLGLRVLGRLVRPALLRWLRDALDATLRTPTPTEVEERFARPLEVVEASPLWPAALRETAARARDRLERGLWRPRLALSHGDLWVGNVLRRPREGWWRVGSPALPFVLIDWRGSQAAGHAVVDLLVLGRSLGLRPGVARRELERHRALLGCEARDLRGYHAARVGELEAGLGCFPPGRFRAGAAANFEYLAGLLASSG